MIAFFWADHRGDRLGRDDALTSPAADTATDLLPQRKPNTDGGGPALQPPAQKAEEEPRATTTAPANTAPPTRTESAPPAETDSTPPAENKN